MVIYEDWGFDFSSFFCKVDLFVLNGYLGLGYVLVYINFDKVIYEGTMLELKSFFREF